jgi:hypothetical protein
MPEGMRAAFAGRLYAGGLQSPANLAIEGGEQAVGGARADEDLAGIAQMSVHEFAQTETFVQIAYQNQPR